MVEGAPRREGKAREVLGEPLCGNCAVTGAEGAQTHPKQAVRHSAFLQEKGLDDHCGLAQAERDDEITTRSSPSDGSSRRLRGARTGLLLGALPTRPVPRRRFAGVSRVRLGCVLCRTLPQSAHPCDLTHDGLECAQFLLEVPPGVGGGGGAKEDQAVTLTASAGGCSRVAAGTASTIHSAFQMTLPIVNSLLRRTVSVSPVRDRTPWRGVQRCA